MLTRVLERARILSLAPSQSCYYPQGFAARSYVVNRLHTDLTTKLARCLRRRDDNRPTLSTTGTHTITNRRQNSLREAILPVFISCVPSCSFISWSSLRDSSRPCSLVRVVDIVLTVGGGRFGGEVRHGNLEGHAPIPLLMSLHRRPKREMRGNN